MVGGGHDSTSFCHILLHHDAASKGPPCRRITTRVTRVKGYRTLQCECCGGLFPSGRGIENHRTVSRICMTDQDENLLQEFFLSILVSELREL
eukprot:scaffold54018_cov67-Attheya_sp.AAC.2